MAYATTLAGSKLRAKLGASLNEHVSAPTSDFAQQQLVKMGWSEGDGLGKRRQGMNSHITVKRREDNVGVGHSNVPTHSQQWWKDCVGDTLAKLGGKTKKKKREFTDEELFEATGGARFGMRAQRKAKAKWARTESQTEEEEREAQSRVEWNGQGAAEVKLARKDTEASVSDNGVNEISDKKSRKTDEVDNTSNSANETSESKKKKKKRKKDKGDESNVSDSANETMGAESRKKKKKRNNDIGDESNVSDTVKKTLGAESKKQRKEDKKLKKAKEASS
jgi:Pin2-interacting protein X1